MHGQAVIAGTRVLVSAILDCLAAGMTAEEITAEYPTVTVPGVRAAAAYGAASRNTQENFTAGAAKVGLGPRDIPPCVTFFAPVAVDPAGRFVWNETVKRPGDFVDLRAEMNTIVVLSNCAHPLNPARPSPSRPITLVRYRAPAAMADDPCRTGSAEAARAFAFTDRLYG